MLKDLQNALHEHATQLAFGFGDDCADVGMNIMKMMSMMLAIMAILEIMSMTITIIRTFDSHDDCQPISDRQL